MKKIMKKLLCAALLCTMVLSLLTGCGKEGNSNSANAISGDYSEKISFTMTNWYSMTNA